MSVESASAAVKAAEENLETVEELMVEKKQSLLGWSLIWESLYMLWIPLINKEAALDL